MTYKYMDDSLDISTNLGDDVSTYTEYLSLCSQMGVTNVQSEEDWTKSKTPGFRFVGPPAMAAAAGAFALRNGEKIISAFQKGGANTAANAVVDALKSEGLSQAKEFIVTLGGNSNASNSNTSNGSGSKFAGAGGFGGSTAGPASLKGIFETNPINLDLRPGLPASVYSDTVNYPESYGCFSHITGLKIGFDVLDPKTKFFFDNVLIPNLQNRAQSSVNFKVDLSLLTSAKIISYLNDIISILSVYYFSSSVLSYCSIPTNKDRGMFALRNMITATDIDYLEQIRLQLPAFPVPPYLNSLLFWLYQNYTDGQNGQVIIKLMPVSFNATADANNFATGFLGANGSVLSNAITNLNRTDNLQISSLLTQITPEWLSSKVFDASPIPIYNGSFSTLFANAPHTYFSGSQAYGPNVPGDDARVFYVSLDSNLDGMILGLGCLFSNNIGTFRPGLAINVNTVGFDGATNRFTNRWSYVYKSTLSQYAWVPSNSTIESGLGRPEIAKAYGVTNYYSMIPNGINVRGVSADIVRESTKSLISWVLSIDTIKSQKKNPNLKNNNSNNKVSKPKPPTSDKA
uniref:Uncharacterized protein n=1 Tax=Shahe picobirna-like virus 1 TaxID=1923437 RepID=A0A1L3KLH4_9VIRU|nr:hypothetical protein [Shahe picobirna-like virus 1]